MPFLYTTGPGQDEGRPGGKKPGGPSSDTSTGWAMLPYSVTDVTTISPLHKAQEQEMPERLELGDSKHLLKLSLCLHWIKLCRILSALSTA